MRSLMLFALTLGVALISQELLAGSSPLANCVPHPFYSSDGTVCKTIEVSNTSSHPDSSQQVTVRYQNGTSAVVTLTKGQMTTFVCYVTSIIAHEEGSTSGEVTWTIS